MYTDRYSELLTDTLGKLRKKDLFLFRIIRKKMDEVLNVLETSPDHYKPLGYSMKEFRRVHIRGSFVLVFKVDAQTKTVFFEDFDHHDNIYRKYR